VSAATTLNLGDVAVFIRGINFKPEDVVPVGTPGTVACLRTKNVQSELDLSDVWGVRDTFVKRDDQYLQVGDVLLSSANSWNLVGKCCWVPELPWRSSFGGFVSVLRADRTKVEPRFLYRWFASDRIQTTVRSFGQQTTNISNLNIDRCLNLLFPSFPLPQQRRIAEVLDRADALRIKRRASLARLDTLTQSIFLDMFGDPATNPKRFSQVTLGDVVKVIGGYAFKSNDFASEGKAVVRISNLDQDGINFSAIARIPESKLGKGAAFKISPGDILIAMSGATTGKLGVVPMECREELYQNQRVGNCRITDTSRIHRDFLLGMLRSDFYQHYLWKLAWGAAQPNVSGGQLQSAIVPLPPLPLQNEFASRIETVERLASSNRVSLAQFDALFASLQDRAFRGEL